MGFMTFTNTRSFCYNVINFLNMISGSFVRMAPDFTVFLISEVIFVFITRFGLFIFSPGLSWCRLPFQTNMCKIGC